MVENLIRWDITSTLILTLVFETILIIKKALKNRGQPKKKEILSWQDILFSTATAATLYGGISAIYYSLKGKLLFSQSMIISQEYMILFAGIVLIGLALLTYKKALKDIKEGRK